MVFVDDEQLQQPEPLPETFSPPITNDGAVTATGESGFKRYVTPLLRQQGLEV